ncbi:right-handed parallel beta-helix repeat-containing protein [Novosphingobium sp. Gsoil 351]|uniref:right-handed parallel beta-helix repeat-containing protein n=1 Tax=Novosphingobium sp. Gsoil 351 TaxID=2675225 RepID=UPI0012B4F6AF|nr:right-handed parallel beta-helix repeat-containing protein [Novosphingobium sp. Gsoil 351]QGN54144.1 hypothetical protein GKE62_05890 [Novosphingobium sp. Gsoil 351]
MLRSRADLQRIRQFRPAVGTVLDRSEKICEMRHEVMSCAVAFAVALATGFACLPCGAAIAANPPISPHGRVFYVSSSEGRDNCLATAPSCPWASLERVNAQTFEAGDQILFKAGDIFNGQLQIRSSGNPGKPLIVATYGAGARPRIDGAGGSGGAYAAAILVRNQHHIEIRGLEISNSVDRPRPGEAEDTAAGILFVNDGGGVLEHIRMTDLHVHDVFAKAVTHTTEDQFNRVTVSGIRFETTDRQTRAAPSYFRDIRISGNRIEHTGRFGVQISNAGPRSRGAGDAQSRDPETGFNRDIVIAENKFFELGGSAVQLAGARDALIENNDFDYCGSSARPDRMVGRGSGAWVVNSRDIVAQRNRSRHVRGYKDSYGMHVDFGNLNVLYQYNYSEDSEGGFVEILGNNRNIIWRYNISVNDGLREKDGNTLWISTWSPRKNPSDEVYIYNNTVFIRSGLFPDLSFSVLNAHVWNNIFYVSPHAMIGEQLKLDLRGPPLDLRNNLFFGKTNAELLAMGSGVVSANPNIANPGATSPEGYRLLPGSAAIGAGTAVAHPPFPDAGKSVFAEVSESPVTDFFGNELKQDAPTNIGADGAGGPPPSIGR